MHTRTTAAAILATALLLAGCSSSNPAPKTDTPTTTAPAANDTPSKADAIAACEQIIETTHDTSASECTGLAPDDYLTAIQQANKAGRDKLLNGAGQ